MKLIIQGVQGCNNVIIVGKIITMTFLTKMFLSVVALFLLTLEEMISTLFSS